MVPTVFFALAATACGRRQSGGCGFAAWGNFVGGLPPFRWPLPWPLPIAALLGRGNRLALPSEASASRRHADAAFQPLAGEFEETVWTGGVGGAESVAC